MRKSSLYCDVYYKQRSWGGVERGKLRECIGDCLKDTFGVCFIGQNDDLSQLKNAHSFRHKDGSSLENT